MLYSVLVDWKKIRRRPSVTTQDLLMIIEEGVENGRVTPYLAAYIASEVLGVDAYETGYDDRVRLDESEYEPFVLTA